MISATKGRFFSLSAIVTIGMAFFVGVSSSSSIMSASVDYYDDTYNLKDITIYSNYGFDDEDLSAVKKMTNVDNAELAKFVDVTGTSGSESRITRIHSYREDASINQFELKSGRLPENENECVAENGSDLKAGFAIGSTITFSRPEDDVSDSLKIDSCKVVGTIDTPLYLDEIKENSTLNNQYIDTYIYLPEEAFATDYYTELNIVLTNAKQYNSFSGEYENYTKQAKETIEEQSLAQKNHRHDVVYNDALKKYNDGLKEYQDSKDEFDTKIADGQKEIDDNQQKIKDGEAALADAKQKLLNAETELTQQKKDFATKKIELNQNIKDIDDALAKIDTGTKSLNEAKTGIEKLQNLKLILAKYDEVTAMITPYKNALGENASVDNMVAAISQDSNIPSETKQTMLTTIQASKSALEYTLSTSQAPVSIQTIGQFLQYLQVSKLQQALLQQNLDTQITAVYKQLNDGLSLTGTGRELASTSDIDTYTATLQATQKDLQTKKQQINDGITSGEQQITDAQKQIDEGWTQINQQSATLEEGKTELTSAIQKLGNAITDGTQKLEDAKSKLDKAKQDIDDLADGKWTVLDRTQHYSSAAYKNTIHQMKSIAAIFPVFFLMVAALVCLTTMTRMVDEQRGQIGIMRALGYSQKQCASKYLIYAGAATLIGCIIGNIAGMLTFPLIIYNAWRMLYILPPIHMEISWSLLILTSIAFLGVMLLTTWYACHEDMREVSAQLMRPKSPKLGKSTLIEKAPIIWNHLTFTWKVTVRNLLRYKKRFFMSVFGVAGCTALLITGYGIRDSIKTIATKQFEVIYKYDGTVSFNKNASVTEINSLYQKYSDNAHISNSTLLSAYTGKVSTEGDDENVYMQIFDQSSDINNMYLLQTRVGQNALALSDDGVIINEKLSENLKKKIGDTITLESKDGVTADVKITGICEMYVRHYVFMTKNCYKQMFGTALADNTMAVKLQGTAEEKLNAETELADAENVNEVEFFDSMLDNFNNMVKGLDIIVIVLIVSSASLAGVVLGNLTNVNISERTREIATLKVLGFRRKEVQNYIYKENNILTFIGSLVGIPLGMMLHSYIMHQVEMDYVMYGREISGLSLIICVAMTLGFGIMVNLFMAKHLRNIEMVESLKSVE